MGRLDRGSSRILKRLCVLFLLQYLFLPGAAIAAPPSAPPSPHVSAAGAVLIDAATGRVLYEKHSHERRHPASTTKIMTGILAFEMGELGELVEVSPWAAGTPGSTMHLKPGERYRLLDLVKGLLMVSGNDAATAIAEYIAGTESTFGVMMTAKARALGLKDSRFRNPHGLTETDHYSSAYDLAQMARYALSIPGFSDIVCLGRADACGEDAAGRTVSRELWSTNQLLFSYQWADGIKTGTTSAAGRCLVASATRSGQKLIAVVLDSRDRWGDAERLMEYGFARWTTRNLAPAGTVVRRAPVARGTVGEVAITPVRDANVVLERRDLGRVRTVINVRPRLSAPLAAGEVVGSLTVILDDRPLERVPLVVARSVPRAPWWRFWKHIGS